MAKATAEEQPNEKWWVVLHTALDHFYQGQVISLRHLRAGSDREIDTDRLERLGALAPVGSDQANALQESLGPDALTPEGDPVSQPVPDPVPDINTPKAPEPAATA